MKQTWHDWEPLVTAARVAHAANPVPTTEADLRGVIKDALSDDVKQTDKLIWQHNDVGKPYSAMGQGDMGVAVLRAGQQLGDVALVKQACMILDVIVKLTSKGGLRRTSASGWWFHSVTSTQHGPGYTLNQHLFACRDLGTAAGLLAGPDPVRAALYRKAAQKGINQLTGTDFPNFKHFMPSTEPRSWAFYSLKDDRAGYFLDVAKNGSYHILVMDLIAQCAARGVTAATGRLPWLLAVYQTKLAEGLSTDSTPSKGGDFRGLVKAKACVPATLSFFEALK